MRQQSYLSNTIDTEYVYSQSITEDIAFPQGITCSYLIHLQFHFHPVFVEKISWYDARRIAQYWTVFLTMTLTDVPLNGIAVSLNFTSANDIMFNNPASITDNSTDNGYDVLSFTRAYCAVMKLTSS